jgi:hypothetical protein
MKNQATRVEALEQHFGGGGVITLLMRDGTSRTIDGRRLVDRMFAFFRGELDQDTELLLASVSDDGYAVCGNHLTEVIRVSAHAESHQGEDNDNTEGMEVVIQ